MIDRVDPNAHATFAEDEEVKRRLDEILIANLRMRQDAHQSVGTGLGLMR